MDQRLAQRRPLMSWLQRVLTAGTLASVLSGLVLAWRGRGDTGSAVAAVNAPSHWIWGHEALRRNDATARHTLLGALVHQASSLFWAFFYDTLQRRRRRPTLGERARRRRGDHDACRGRRPAGRARAADTGVRATSVEPSTCGGVDPSFGVWSRRSADGSMQHPQRR